MLGSTLAGSLPITVSCLAQSNIRKKHVLTIVLLGWAKWMEWMYPVEVRFTNKSAFNAAGAVEAAATL